MSQQKMHTGRWGEKLAGEFLEKGGYEIVERNFRTEYGEIDLIARRGDMVVFVEVKTRRGDGYGMPEEAVTAAKREHLMATASAYLQQHPEHEGEWRVDVIAIRKPPGRRPAEIRHFENAIQG